MRWRLDGVLEISLPDDWQPVAIQSGTVLVRTQDLEAAGSVEQVGALSLFVGRLANGTERSASQQIEQLMARRVPQGNPERFRDDMSGVLLQGFEWTDGISDVLSFFARITDGTVVELQTSRAGWPHTSPASLLEASAPLLRGIRWLTTVVASEVWSVWRQDDNGNQARVSTGHTREEADSICQTFEGRGHKQLYWPAIDDGAK